MTLNDYQKAAERTSGDLTSWDKVRNGCYGLNGEAGERIGVDVEAWNKERKELDETEKH